MKTRKGLSTVVGMVFAIIALTTTISYVGYSMNTLNNYNQAVLVNNQQNLNTMNEKFQVASATITNNKFNITVVNTGNIPINFTKIWIQNTTGIDWVHSYVPTNSMVTPGGILTNIGKNIPVSALSSNSYNIKLVTSRGNSYQFYVNSPNQAPVPLQIISAPATVPTGFQTTLILTVTNNMTNNAVLTNVTPAPLSIVSNNGVTQNCDNAPPIPASYSIIPVGTTAMFQWTCTVSGSVGTSITYNATLQNGYNHNYALTTIAIGNVLFAAQSASAVTAQGLTAPQSSNSILLFDQNQFSVPNGGYQMYNTQVDNSTNKFLQIDQSTSSFYTNNGTATTISPGKWNATLRYMDSPVSLTTFSSNQYPDIIYHFEDYLASKPNNIGDSMGNQNITSISGNPSWSSNNGVNNTSAFTFVGTSSQYMSAPVKGGHTDVPSGSNPASTAMWFKTSVTDTNQHVLARIGDSSSNPYYIIYINTQHHLVFQFSDHNNNNGHGGQIDVTCTGTKTVDDKNWHHVIVEKTGTASCKLYVDGSSDGSSTPGTACTPNGGSADCANISGHLDIGRDQSTNTNYFSGNIDDFMHWNDIALSTSQVTDLYKTTYGINAEKVTFTIYETDQDGNNPTTIVQSNSYPLPFMDGWYKSANQAWYSSNQLSGSAVWGHYNYTVTLPQVTVSSSQRIEIIMTYVPPSNGNMGMKMIIDNSALTDQWGQSLLQTPTLTAPFMGYYAYLANTCNGNNSNYRGDHDGQVYVYNAGPDISWVSQGSRGIFMTYDKSGAYAGWIFFATGNHNFASRTDSISTQVGTSTLLYYSTPYTQPGLDGYQQGTEIPPGNYKLYIYINGYDEEGHSLLSTDYIGTVRVYNTNTQC